MGDVMDKKPAYEELEQKIRELQRDANSRINAEETDFEYHTPLMNTLLDNLQVGVFMVEAPTGKPLLANKRATELLGRGIMNGADKSNLADVYKAYKYGTDDFYPKEEMPIVKGLSGEYHHIDDMEVVQPDGTRLLLEVHGSPVKDNQDQIIGSLVSFIDITERKRSESALKQNEETIRSIFKAAPTGIGMVKDRIITEANDKLCKMIGRSREEIIHKNARLLYPSDEDYEYVGRVKYNQIKEHGTGTVETRWQHKDGAILDILLSSTPKNVDDWSEGVTFTALDITKRKQTEKKLRASHEMFLTVLDSIESTIYVADMRTYEILFTNKHMIESYGKDLTGHVCYEVLCNESKPCTHCTKDKLLDSNRPGGVYEWQDKNPKTGKWHMKYERAIEWVDGRLVRIQIATDITKLKRLESQLLQSQKMEAIGNLAGGIAHDFNNILSAIIGYSELSFNEIKKGSSLEKYMLEIHKAGLRARDLVKRILMFARKADQDLKPVMVSTIATEVMKLLRSTIPVSIEIKSQINSESLVLSDPTQIHQIFMNLCTNAAHALEEEGGVLEINLSDIEWTESDTEITVGMEPGDYLKITIADTGKGIPEQTLPLIFEPYFTTKSMGEGTGLGLSVVHGIVKGYGGEILVKSKPGKGTTFTIYLPLIERHAEKKTLSTENLQTGNERILLVDDELPICTTGSQILKRLGYTVTVQTSSMEALELFRSKPDDFDLVITDMTMPNLNGDKLAMEMMKTRPDIPIILCTGYNKMMSNKRASEIGFKAFTMKPLTTVDLSKTVRKVLDKETDISKHPQNADFINERNFHV